MTERLEIDPEIRGLMEEIVADPNSAIRLVPRAPLRKWFERADGARVADIAETAAEKYLVSAHREALARTLLLASRIAYWKAPGVLHRSIGPNGAPFDEVLAEREWLPLAGERLTRRSGNGPEVELLRQSLTGIQGQSAHALARAAVNLVPSFESRFYLALTLPPISLRWSVYFLERLICQTHEPEARAQALSLLAIRLCSLGDLRRALDTYIQASELLPESPLPRFYVFNLSCVLGDARAAEQEAQRLASLVAIDDRRVLEATRILRDWYRPRKSESSRANDVGTRLAGRIPPVASVLCEAMKS